MPIATVRLDDQQAAWVTAQTTRYRKKADVIRDLIDTARQGLTTSATLVKRREDPSEKGDSMSEASSSKAVPKEELKEKKNKTKTREAFSSKQLPDDCMPNGLLDCDQLLREFWTVKKGTRSESVFNRVCRKLEAWTPEDRRKALEAAISAGWGDVFEPRATPAQGYRKTETDWDAIQAEIEKIPTLW